MLGSVSTGVCYIILCSFEISLKIKKIPHNTRQKDAYLFLHLFIYVTIFIKHLYKHYVEF